MFGGSFPKIIGIFVEYHKKGDILYIVCSSSLNYTIILESLGWAKFPYSLLFPIQDPSSAQAKISIYSKRSSRIVNASSFPFKNFS